MNKYIFLDIDGVLNSHRTCHAFKGYPATLNPYCLAKFDHAAIGLIRRVCKETGAKVVISSTWRKFYSFEEIGEKLQLPTVGQTPDLCKANSLRGDEIKAWLNDNTKEEYKYAIIDDDSDMLEEQKPFFVHTTHMNGLLWEHYEQLISILK